MELKNTIELMTSSDYNDRFKAEYHQLCIRIDKLEAMLEKYENNQLDFVPKCSYELLNSQLEAMYNYKDCLLERAIIEDVNITFIDDITFNYIKQMLERAKIEGINEL